MKLIQGHWYLIGDNHVVLYLGKGDYSHQTETYVAKGNNKHFYATLEDLLNTLGLEKLKNTSLKEIIELMAFFEIRMNNTSRFNPLYDLGVQDSLNFSGTIEKESQFGTIRRIIIY